MQVSLGQPTVEVARDKVIEAPAASPTTLNAPVNLTSKSVEYIAEDEVILEDGFYMTGTSTSSSNYFLARILPSVGHAELKEKLDGSFCGTNGHAIYFKYIEKYNEGVLKYQVYDYQRNEMIPVATRSVDVNVNGFLLTKTLGTNFYKLDLTKATGFVGTNELDSYYLLEVENDKGDKYFLRFKYLTNLNYNY